MRVERLVLRDLRNHVSTTVDAFSPSINVFAGQNGAGKTSLLEALSLATLTKSFSTSADAPLVRDGAPALMVRAEFSSDLDVPVHVNVDLQLGPPIRKRIEVNNDKLRAANELIGRAPVVVLTPDDRVITNGPPGERRRFMNIVLSQASRTYLQNELEYKRALKQRNALLATAKQERRSHAATRSLLEPWTVLALQHGAQIMRRRAKFIEEFRPYLIDAYRQISVGSESPELHYQPMGMHMLTDTAWQETAVPFLEEQFVIVANDELRRGTTLAGPHRDDIELLIDHERPARDHASQGQHKTLVIAMKIAEFHYLRESTSETPLLLLDDVFSELDQTRAGRLLELALEGSLGQTLITSTDERLFTESLPSDSNYQLYRVTPGSVTPTR